MKQQVYKGYYRVYRHARQDVTRQLWGKRTVVLSPIKYNPTIPDTKCEIYTRTKVTKFRLDFSYSVFVYVHTQCNS